MEGVDATLPGIGRNGGCRDVHPGVEEGDQRPGSPMRRKTVAFGMNSMFAVRQFLPEILEMAGGRGFRVVVITPAEASFLRYTSAALPGVEFRFVSLKREIS